MRTLGIETSCDETALALVQDGRLLGQVIASQARLHALFGGVVPEIASREHYRILDSMCDSLCQEAGLELEDLDVVAVARGPGLLGSLLTGLGFAKGLVLGVGAKLVGVDHLLAHLLAVGLERALVFPALGLLVSGGHTHLCLLESPTRCLLLGRTLDDAAGEALDKSARLMGLPYPGGRYVDALAQVGRVDTERFPRPYLDNTNLDFSFSGLKTAVANVMRQRAELVLPSGETPPPDILARQCASEPLLRELADICACLNHSVAETLRIKTRRALKGRREVKALIVAGGVAANSMIRTVMTEVAEEHGLDILLPSPLLCTDNAAMVAYAGECFAKAGLEHGLDLDAVPRGRVVPWDYLGRC